MIPLALTIAAFILAAIDQFNARGRSLLAWSVILICVVMLWGKV